MCGGKSDGKKPFSAWRQVHVDYLITGGFMRKKLLSVVLSLSIVLAIAHAENAIASGADIFLDLLGGVADSMADDQKFKNCLGGNSSNGAQCLSESWERKQLSAEKMKHRQDAREQRERIKEEREAMAACEREQDPDRYMRCVKESSR